MKFATFAFAAALFLLLPLSARADRLDTMSEQLDRLEPTFWRALSMRSQSEYRKGAEKLLSDTIATAREIQAVASRAGSNLPNLTAEMNKLRIIFDEVESFAAENYRFDFKFTSLRDYEKQFHRDQPERRKNKEKPTLANIRLGDYERWLDEIARDNTGKIRRSGGKSGSGAGERTDKLMKERTAIFFQAVGSIRATLARYRQEKKLEFPE